MFMSISLGSAAMDTCAAVLHSESWSCGRDQSFSLPRHVQSRRHGEAASAPYWQPPMPTDMATVRRPCAGGGTCQKVGDMCRDFGLFLVFQVAIERQTQYPACQRLRHREVAGCVAERLAHRREVQRHIVKHGADTLLLQAGHQLVAAAGILQKDIKHMVIAATAARRVRQREQAQRVERREQAT